MDTFSTPAGTNGSPRAVVVGSGPNGLTAAAFLARAGWEVDIYERNPFPGGAAASTDHILGPGTIVDRGAAAHPFGIASPAFRELQLEEHGLEWCQPRFPMAHPLDDQPAAFLHTTLDETAEGLDRDAKAWRKAHGDMVEGIDKHLENLLGPALRWPTHPMSLARFGWKAVASADMFTKMTFRTQAARALFGGSAAHSMTPLSSPFTAAFGLLFGALGMTRGWPTARGGSQSIVDALLKVIAAHGGRLHLNHEITDLRELSGADATILNITPAQVLQLRGLDMTAAVRRRLAGWNYGTAVHKIDYLLDGPVPWADPAVAHAGTVHVGGIIDEIDEAEAQVRRGILPDQPFVIVSQQQDSDPSRSADPSKHVIWAYAHVPHGYVEQYPGEVRERIEAQISRFAPEFQNRVLSRFEQTPKELEEWNPNIVGGDAAGGRTAGLQTVLRPGFTLDPHRLRQSGLYMASSATPPGPGVHGMPGYWAAQAAMQDQRKQRPPLERPVAG